MVAQKVYPAERAKEANIRTVPCPRCDAEPGRACREKSGRGMKYLPISHQGRLNTWEATK